MSEQRILVGNVIDRLRELPDDHFHCCVTSSPYYGQRDYKTDPQVWTMTPLQEACEHQWRGNVRYVEGGGGGSSAEAFSEPGEANAARLKAARWKSDATCSLCGAWKGELGQEPTLALFIEHLVFVFRELRRVLRPDGVVFLNMGDSYCGAGYGNHAINGEAWKAEAGLDRRQGRQQALKKANAADGLKEKDLMFVPQSVALALRADGWWLRSQLPWVKRSAMPEPVVDRPASAIEYVFMLTKSARCAWDAVAVRRESTSWEQDAHNQRYAKVYEKADASAPFKQPGNENHRGIHARPGPGGRNFRNTDLFFDSLGMTADDFLVPNADGERQRRSPTWQERKAAGATRGNVAAPGNVGAGTQRSVHGKGQSHDLGVAANAGPDFDSLGLILDDDGMPMALDVNPHGFSGAHFAVFPEKLVRPLILGGTSERGSCASCGASWKRTTETEYKQHEKWFGPKQGARHSRGAAGTSYREPIGTRTTGWEPACDCGAPVVPCRVIDPFVGSGTVLLVADQLGRDGTGIELNESYARMAEERVRGASPMFVNVEVV